MIIKACTNRINYVLRFLGETFYRTLRSIFFNIYYNVKQNTLYSFNQNKVAYKINKKEIKDYQKTLSLI